MVEGVCGRTEIFDEDDHPSALARLDELTCERSPATPLLDPYALKGGLVAADDLRGSATGVAASGAALLAPFIVLRWRNLQWQMTRRNDEQATGLLLAWTVPLFMASAVAAVFLIADVNPPSELWSRDNVRYVIFALPGIVWGPWRTPAPTSAAQPASTPASQPPSA